MDEIKTIFEDNDLLVVDKPAGVLVHPTEAGETETLSGWLLEKYPEIAKFDWPDIRRAGIVHRLDKETSGLIVLAKNPETLERLQSQFKNRDVKKTYQALVVGKTPAEGKIEVGIVRHPDKDMMMAQETAYSFTKGTVRPAITLYKSIRLYTYKSNALTLVEVMPQTGRMHQIRVHLKYAGYPIIGDPLYYTKLSKNISDSLGLSRQFLQAVKLEIDDKIFESELADDLKQVLFKLS